MNDNAPLVILAAGGTGGHVFPACALGDELIRRGYRIAVATDTRGLKYFEGMDASVPRHVIASGTYGAGIKGKISGVAGLVKGFFQSVKIIRKYRPVAVVGFGGYPSAPPLFAAQLLAVPTILHEQNAILGLANKILLPLADRLALSYAETVGIPDKEKRKTPYTGNPVRHDIAYLSQLPYPSFDPRFVVMVVGGSQGAKVFSDVVPEAFAALPQDLQKKLFVIQQSRPDALDKVKAIYESTDIDFEIRSFYDDMPQRIQAAHLFITRSGASTVAELTAAGRPAVYVPFPWNRDNQQVFNAEQVEKSGGGWMVLEKDLTVDGLKTRLEDLFRYPENLSKAAESARKLGRVDAAKRLADAVAEYH